MKFSNCESVFTIGSRQKGDFFAIPHPLGGGFCPGWFGERSLAPRWRQCVWKPLTTETCHEPEFQRDGTAAAG